MRYGTNTSNPLAVQQQQIVAQQRAAAQQLVLQQQQQQQQAVHQQSMAPVIASNVQPVAQSVARQPVQRPVAPPSPQISVVSQRQPPIQQTATPNPPIVGRPTVQEQPKPTRPPMPNTVRRQPAPQKQSGHQILKDLNPTLYDSLVPIVKPKSQLSKAQKRRLRAQRQKNGALISDTSQTIQPKTHTAQTLKIEAAPSVA